MSSIDKKEKSQFLKEISCMTREDIREYLNRKNNTKIKIFCPVYFVNKDGSIEEPVYVPLIFTFVILYNIFFANIWRGII